MTAYRVFRILAVTATTGVLALACSEGGPGYSGLPTDAGLISFSHVQPVLAAGNPNCVGLGYDFGFKPQPEPPPNGTYFFGGPVTNPPHALTTESVTITNQPGDRFDWTSTLGIDAVIVKGGPNSNIYVYDPPTEEITDTGLHSPINPNNEPYAISHIEFCYDWELDIEKTAETSFTRTYDWSIDKSERDDITELLLSAAETFTVNYGITVSNTGFTDSDWAVSGAISVSNNTPLTATVTSVTDVVSPSIAATVVCPPFPVVLNPGDALTCAYSTALPDGSNRVNTAAVETTGQVGGGQATAAVTFGDPTTEIDECVDVTDDLLGPLGTVCADQSPHTFDVTYDIRFDDCGDFDVINTATFTTNDAGNQGSDSWTIRVTVVGCDGDPGCTLTPGYWKTHSEFGPAPYDDTWALLPNGASTPFFLSGATYYDVLWTPPRGNAYYILARAYIAAQLNGLNGADLTDAQAAFNAATALFNTYTPAQIASLRGRNTVRKDFIALAATLDDYNNGVIGPGHCDEDTSSNAS